MTHNGLIYFNNAATSYPKPPEVIDAVRNELARPPVNPYRDHVDRMSADIRCRIKMAEFFKIPDIDRVVLCSGGTEALNMAIHGLIQEKGHVITTSLEHNAVLRPLYHFESQGRIQLEVLPFNSPVGISADDLNSAIRTSTNLVVVNHASNVTGTIVNMDSIYQVCHNLGIPLIVDASQSAGSIILNISEMPLAVIAFTGHKSLMGPPGTGGLIVGTGLDLKVWKLGGTGLRSEDRFMPDIWPNKYEAGTMNHPGLAGLSASLKYLNSKKMNTFVNMKKTLTGYLENGLLEIPGVSLHSVPGPENPCGIVSFNIEGWSAKDVGYILKESYNIQVRTGLHCAPLVHKALNTYPSGTIRVSFSHFNQIEEVERLIRAVSEIKSKS